MPDSAIPVQHSLTVIEIRPFKAAGSVTRVPVSNRYWTGDGQKRTQSATPVRVQNSDEAKFGF